MSCRTVINIIDYTLDYTIKQFVPRIICQEVSVVQCTPTNEQRKYLKCNCNKREVKKDTWCIIQGNVVDEVNAKTDEFKQEKILKYKFITRGRGAYIFLPSHLFDNCLYP